MLYLKFYVIFIGKCYKIRKSMNIHALAQVYSKIPSLIIELEISYVKFL